MDTTQTTTHGTPDVKIERFQRNLRVPLSQAEIAERAQRAAHLLGERDHKDEELKAASKQAKAQIAEVEAELRRVSGEIRDGATYKEVGCERRHNYRLGMIQEVRTDLDPQVVIAERAMTDRERQLDLGLDEVGKNGKAKAAAAPKANGKPNGTKSITGGELSESFLDEENPDYRDDAVEAAASDEVEEEEDEDDGVVVDDLYEPEPALATQKTKKKRATRRKS